LETGVSELLKPKSKAKPDAKIAKSDTTENAQAEEETELTIAKK
jgi:hypothetical protein